MTVKPPKAVSYLKITTGKLKSNALKASRDKYVKQKTDQMFAILNVVYVDLVTHILKKIAKKLGLLVVSRESLHLTPSQCIVVRDYVGTSTNGIH